ncbi:MAG: hypothetical protein J6X01_00675 [Bacteroidales bacterium]|nr:hypothetical protein [Bacteroidales bacterium]
MKKIFLYACVLLIAVLLTACNKDVKKITGDYSYKLSGVVNFEDADGNQTSILATKRGQMNIVADKKEGKGAIIVTFNEMNGGAYSCTGKVEGNTIVFNPYEFSTRFTSADSVVDLIQLGHVYTIQSRGEGQIHDNVILMEEQWMGRPENGDMIRMKADKITLLAEEN